MRHINCSFLALVVGLCICSPVLTAQAQEVKRAPTVEQCHVDQRLWMSKLEVSNGADTANASYDELSGWAHEMFECEKVDPEFRNRYVTVSDVINMAQLMRLATLP
jgi:hypothetical protein